MLHSANNPGIHSFHRMGNYWFIMDWPYCVMGTGPDLSYQCPGKTDTSDWRFGPKHF